MTKQTFSILVLNETSKILLVQSPMIGMRMTILKYETYTKDCGLNVGCSTVEALLLLIKTSMKQQLLAFNSIRVKLRSLLVIFSEIQTLINK